MAQKFGTALSSIPPTCMTSTQGMGLLCLLSTVYHKKFNLLYLAVTSSKLIVQPFVILGSKTLFNLDSTEKDCSVLEIVNNLKPFLSTSSLLQPSIAIRATIYLKVFLPQIMSNNSGFPTKRRILISSS